MVEEKQTIENHELRARLHQTVKRVVHTPIDKFFESSPEPTRPATQGEQLLSMAICHELNAAVKSLLEKPFL